MGAEPISLMVLIKTWNGIDDNFAEGILTQYESMKKRYLNKLREIMLLLKVKAIVLLLT